MRSEDFIMMPVPMGMFTAVCALIGSGAASAVPAAPKPAERPTAAAEPAAEQSGSGAGASQGANEDGAGNGAVEIDAHGHPWSAELHAATKGTTKDGLWRMKVGVSRPAPLPGFPKAEGGAASTGTASGGTGSDAGGSAATTDAGEDDEFAAFRAAAAKSDETDKAAAASVQPRKWSDADLGALCNQAAVKLGDPTPVKEIIATFIPEGQVAHSRNIPEDRREDFAKAVEAKAGIEFAG